MVHGTWRQIRSNPLYRDATIYITIEVQGEKLHGGLIQSYCKAAEILYGPRGVYQHRTQINRAEYFLEAASTPLLRFITSANIAANSSIMSNAANDGANRNKNDPNDQRNHYVGVTTSEANKAIWANRITNTFKHHQFIWPDDKDFISFNYSSDIGKIKKRFYEQCSLYRNAYLQPEDPLFGKTRKIITGKTATQADDLLCALGMNMESISDIYENRVFLEEVDYSINT
jgi:hypothetical protein